MAKIISAFKKYYYVVYTLVGLIILFGVYSEIKSDLEIIKLTKVDRNELDKFKSFEFIKADKDVVSGVQGDINAIKTSIKNLEDMFKQHINDKSKKEEK